MFPIAFAHAHIASTLLASRKTAADIVNVISVAVSPVRALFLSGVVPDVIEIDFSIEAVEEALARHGKPEIFNSDQGSQFTSTDFIKVLAAREIRISMDGKGARRDNVFVERLGEPSNTRRSTCGPMPAFQRPARRSGATSASTISYAHIHRLTAKPPIRLTSTH